MPLGTMLLGIFVTLKLLGLIAWSWWWVLSPLFLTIVYCFVFAWLSLRREDRQRERLRRNVRRWP